MTIDEQPTLATSEKGAVAAPPESQASDVTQSEASVLDSVTNPELEAVLASTEPIVAVDEAEIPVDLDSVTTSELEATPALGEPVVAVEEAEVPIVSDPLTTSEPEAGPALGEPVVAVEEAEVPIVLDSMTTSEPEAGPAPSEPIVAVEDPGVSETEPIQVVLVNPDPDIGTSSPHVDHLPEAPGEASVQLPAQTEVPAVGIVATALVPTQAVLAPIVEPKAAAPVTTVAVSTKVASATDTDLFDSYMHAFDAGQDAADAELGYKRVTKGERVEATIIQVDQDKVFVDIGTKAEAIVPLVELSESSLETAKGLFNVGDKINVVVLRPEGAEGNPIVSKRRADFEEAWDRVEGAFKSGEMINAQVVDRVKGGLVVDVGVRGFVPATHVGSGKLRNIEKFVGQSLLLKVIEIDRDRKKVVLSNREAEEQKKRAAKDQIFTDVSPGDILEGTVRRLTDYGAFIDLGGVDGLLHISEMSWARITHPKEIFKEGQRIKVMVLRLDASAGKISLGHRQVLPDPWNLIKEKYTINQKLTVTIGRIVQSGAFIKLPEGAEAFLPASEMSNRRIKRPQDVIEENQEVEVTIIDLRPDERRMVLSLRGPSEGRGRDFPPSGTSGEDFRRGSGDPKRKKKGGRGRDDGGMDDFEDSTARRGVATGGATIGERLGMLKGLLSSRDDEEETSTGGSKSDAEGNDPA